MKLEMQKFETLTRVDDFGDKHVSVFPEGTAAAALLAAVGSDRQTLAALLIARTSCNSAMRTAHAEHMGTRKALRKQLGSVDRTARSLDVDKFRAPRKASDRQLIHTGHSFVADAEPLKEQFVLQGLSPSFLEDLKTTVDQLETAISNDVSAKAARKASIREFNERMEQAWKNLKRLDVLVANTMADKPAVLAAWETARHVHRVPVAKAAAPDVNPSANASAA